MGFPCYVKLVYFHSAKITLDIRHSDHLNIHKTFRTRPGRLLNVLCMFNLRPMSTGLDVKFKSLNERDKSNPHKDVASIFGETKNTLSSCKKGKYSNCTKTTLGLKE